VAILQERPPSSATVLPGLRAALISRVVVEQDTGLLRVRLADTVEDAFILLRRYRPHPRRHLTAVACALMTDSATRSARSSASCPVPNVAAVRPIICVGPVWGMTTR
jgi:hypothetical protein